MSARSLYTVEEKVMFPPRFGGSSSGAGVRQQCQQAYVTSPTLFREGQAIDGTVRNQGMASRERTHQTARPAGPETWSGRTSERLATGSPPAAAWMDCEGAGRSDGSTNIPSRRCCQTKSSKYKARPPALNMFSCGPMSPPMLLRYSRSRVSLLAAT